MRPSESKKRILWLHDRIRGGSYPNSRRVAERFGISERQAQRDISRLRNDFGAPLEYSPSRGGFCYSSEFSLPEAVRETDAEEGVTAIAASESDVADAAQMMIPYTAVYLCEGENDGLLTPDSAKWGDFKGIVKTNSNRGISHCDEVDLRRRKLSGREGSGVSDITEVYGDILKELKKRGF